MILRARAGLLITLVAVCIAASRAQAGAQASATTAAIDGTVMDASGAALPGVTVTATSPVLQGSRTAVTSPEGVYRLPQLPPGEYRIAYEMPGFGSVVRERQALAVGFTATINVNLSVSALEEAITVQGESPVVDRRASRIVTTFDAEKLASLPSSRDIWSIMAVSPAVQLTRVDVGGSTAGTQTAYSSYDTKSDQHRPMVEGMVMTEGTNAAGFYYDYGSFAEVSVGSGSHGADMGWPGISTSFISKSGGNAYHGRLYGDYQSGDIQAYNVDEAQAAFLSAGGGLEPRDLNRMVRYYDLNGDVGGYLRKDRLWWYGSLRNQQIDVRYPNFAVKPFVTELTNYTGKGTYTLSQNNKLIGYGQWGTKAQPNRLDYYNTSSSSAIHTSEESTWDQGMTGHVWKGEWSSVLSNQSFLELRAGQFGYVWTNDRYGDSPSFQDLGNNQVRGSNRDWGQHIQRDQVLGAISFFKDNWLGSHTFKVGGEVFRETIDYLRGLDDGDGASFPGNVLHVLRNGQPIEVFQFGAPARSVNGLWTWAGYVSDTWQPTGRLTFNLGLRFERYRGFLPGQQRGASQFFPEAVTIPAVDEVFAWNHLSPRVGVNYDVTGDGRTLLKFNYGQYWWNPGTALAGNVNTNPPDLYRRYAWTDVNGSGVWEPGEEGTLLAAQGGAGSAEIDPDLQNTFTREVAVWLDRELMPNFGLRTGVVYRRIDQQFQTYNANRPYDAFTVPVTIQDPGPDGRAWTGDDGGTFEGFNLDPATLALAPVSVVRNGPGVSEFWTWELTGTKRMSDRWSALATFSYRWNDDFDSGYFGSNLRASDLPVSPNDLINTDEGRYDFSTWAFKLTASYDAPWGLRLSPSYRHQAGQPFGRTFLATMNYGSQRVLAEPIDSRRQPAINLIDLRVEKWIPVGRWKLAGVLDVYNLTNANTEQNINWNSGTTFLAPSNIVGPRILRFGGRFEW